MEKEALHTADIKFSLDLHPSATGDVMEGVRDQLNAVLLRYSTHLEGVLVSYTHPRILSQQARIHPYFPYFHVDVLAECVLFKPAAGHILDGKVHMVSHDFIGLLVLGLFNVSIGRRQIRADLNYDAVGDCWQSQRHEKHRIAVGTPLRFTVNKVDDESEFFTLAGSLLAPGTGDVVYVSQQAKKKDKKRRHSEAAATDAPTAGAAAASAAVRRPSVAVTKALPPHAAVKASSSKSHPKPANESAKAPAPVPATVPARSGEAAPSTAAPGPTADVSSLKKKKRRKHHDTPTQTAPFAASDRAAHSGPFNNTQGHAEHAKPAAKRPTANGPAAVPSEAAATSPAAPHQAAAASTPTADQAAASNPLLQHQQQTSGALEHGFLDPQTDGKKVKQKSHKKKKREIDKPAVTPTSLQPGQSAAAASQEQPLRAETAVTAALDQNGTASGSKKKHKKHKQ